MWGHTGSWMVFFGRGKGKILTLFLEIHKFEKNVRGIFSWETPHPRDFVLSDSLTARRNSWNLLQWFLQSPWLARESTVQESRWHVTLFYTTKSIHSEHICSHKTLSVFFGDLRQGLLILFEVFHSFHATVFFSWKLVKVKKSKRCAMSETSSVPESPDYDMPQEVSDMIKTIMAVAKMHLRFCFYLGWKRVVIAAIKVEHPWPLTCFWT